MNTCHTLLLISLFIHKNWIDRIDKSRIRIYYVLEIAVQGTIIVVLVVNL